MVYIITGGGDCCISLSFVRKIVVDSDQDHLFESHVIRDLQGYIGDCGAFPNATGKVKRESRTGVSCIKKYHILREFLKETIGMPGNKFGYGLTGNLPGALLDHQVIDGNKE